MFHRGKFVTHISFLVFALLVGSVNAFGGVNSVTITNVTPTGTWFKATDLPAVVSVTYSWSGSNITGAALSIGAPPPPLGTPIAVQNISFTADSGTRTDKVPLPVGLADGKLSVYVVVLSSTSPNNSLAQQGQAIWIDKTPPTITVSRYPDPTASGWNNTDVTLSFNCTDGGESGVTSCPEPATITGEGADQSVVVVSTDAAGNKRILTVDNINIDKTPPRLNIKTPISNAIYALTQKVTADWSAVDDWSGVSIVSVSSAKGTLVDTGNLGVREFHLNVVDGAGNAASLSLNYLVSYNFAFSTLRANKVNTVPVNKTLQIKFQVLNGQRKPIKNVAATLWYRAADSKGKPIDDFYRPAPAKAPFEGETFAYNANSAFYFYNVDAAAIGPGYWQFEVRLDDGTTRTISIFIKGRALAPRSVTISEKLAADSASTPSPFAITLSVYDITGRLVLITERSMAEATLALTDRERDTLANGVYFYRIIRTGRDGQSQTSAVQKFVKIQ
jgi:hypothetical protein